MTFEQNLSSTIGNIILELVKANTNNEQLAEKLTKLQKEQQEKDVLTQNSNGSNG